MTNFNLHARVRDWLAETYPDMDVVATLNGDVTFGDVVDALNRNDGSGRSVLGCYDHRTLNRVLDRTAELLFLPCSAVHNKHMAGRVEPELRVDELAQRIGNGEILAGGLEIVSVEECMDGDYGASVVQFRRPGGEVSFAFSAVPVEDAVQRPELVLAEMVRQEPAEPRPLWSALSEDLLSLVVDSGFDMFFVEADDECWTEETANRILDEAVENGLHNVVTPGEDGLVTVYAGAMGSVNWAGHPDYGVPCLECVVVDKDAGARKPPLSTQMIEASTMGAEDSFEAVRSVPEYSSLLLVRR